MYLKNEYIIIVLLYGLQIFWLIACFSPAPIVFFFFFFLFLVFRDKIFLCPPGWSVVVYDHSSLLSWTPGRKWFSCLNLLWVAGTTGHATAPGCFDFFVEMESWYVA